MKYHDLRNASLSRIARVIVEKYRGRTIYVPSEDGSTLLYLDDACSPEETDSVDLYGNTFGASNATVTANRRQLNAIREAVRITSKGDLMDYVLDEETRRKCDTTLPRGWWQDFQDLTGHDPRGTMVYHVNDGRPVALTRPAQSAIMKYNRETGSTYPVIDTKLDAPLTRKAHGDLYMLRP